LSEYEIKEEEEVLISCEFLVCNWFSCLFCWDLQSSITSNVYFGEEILEFAYTSILV